MTVQQYHKMMKARAKELKPALESTTKGLAKSALRLSKERMTEGIYSQPVPTKEQVKAEQKHARALKSGRIAEGTPFEFTPTSKKRSPGSKPAWRRTGHLRRSERIDLRGPAAFAIQNTAAYGEPRHEAGKPDRKSVRYVCHWQDEMAEVMRAICHEQWRETCLDVMKRAG